MKFWDTSAIIPLILEETASSRMNQIYLTDSVLMVWWNTEVECISAVARFERESTTGSGNNITANIDKILGRLKDFRCRWNEILPAEKIRDLSIRLLRVHPLRSADALQLAAAINCAQSRPATLDFVCLDQRLITAARKEGFNVLS